MLGGVSVMGEYILWIGLMVGVPAAIGVFSAIAGVNWVRPLRKMIADHAILTVLLVFLFGVALGYSGIGDGELTSLLDDTWQGVGDLRRWIYDTECAFRFVHCELRVHSLFDGAIVWTT